MTKPKPYVFVLMPFDSSFDDIYHVGIKATCEEVGAFCERVDEQIFQERILDRIYNQIDKADILVADMTGRNPNVFYETGYAHALGKNVVLLTQHSEDIPFDLKHHPHIIYGGNIIDLKDKLSRRLSVFLNSAKTGVSEHIFPLELYIGRTRLIEGEEVSVKPVMGDALTIHNPTSNVFEGGDIRIGLVYKEAFSSKFLIQKDASSLPGGDTLRQLTFNSRLFPDAWESVMPAADIMPFARIFTVRLYTRTGPHDFMVSCE
jgi:hypothetical protein